MPGNSRLTAMKIRPSEAKHKSWSARFEDMDICLFVYVLMCIYARRSRKWHFSSAKCLELLEILLVLYLIYFSHNIC